MYGLYAATVVCTILLYCIMDDFFLGMLLYDPGRFLLSFGIMGLCVAALTSIVISITLRAIIWTNRFLDYYIPKEAVNTVVDKRE